MASEQAKQKEEEEEKKKQKQKKTKTKKKNNTIGTCKQFGNIKYGTVFVWNQHGTLLILAVRSQVGLHCKNISIAYPRHPKKEI